MAPGLLPQLPCGAGGAIAILSVALYGPNAKHATRSTAAYAAMNEMLLKSLATRSGPAPSPGDSMAIGSPSGSKAIEAAVVQHHRFAFYYWIRWTTEKWIRSLPTKQNAPDLVTVDYHNDVGGECDCKLDELDLLREPLEIKDTSDPRDLDDASRRRNTSERNVSAYCFLGLRTLNDGHIYPAQYINAIGDTFVLYKQGNPSQHTTIDRHGLEHTTRYFNDPTELANALNTTPNRETYFDLDIDYFFEDPKNIHGQEEMIAPESIRQLMSPESDLMSSILQRNLQGLTFALEPTYCGGLSGCFNAMSIVMDSLFSGELLGGADLTWK